MKYKLFYTKWTEGFHELWFKWFKEQCKKDAELAKKLQKFKDKIEAQWDEEVKARIYLTSIFTSDINQVTSTGDKMHSALRNSSLSNRFSGLIDNLKSNQ